MNPCQDLQALIQDVHLLLIKTNSSTTKAQRHKEEVLILELYQKEKNQ